MSPCAVVHAYPEDAQRDSALCGIPIHALPEGDAATGFACDWTCSNCLRAYALMCLIQALGGVVPLGRPTLEEWDLWVERELARLTGSPALTAKERRRLRRLQENGHG